MKMFMVKMINCILIIMILFSYQSYASKKERDVLAFNQKVKIARKEWEKESIRISGEQNAPKYADGKYQGKGIGFGGKIVVEVSVCNGEIDDVEIISAKKETPDYVEMMNALIEKIVDAQGTEVDVVSGATFSSNGVLDAVDDALSKAGNK